MDPFDRSILDEWNTKCGLTIDYTYDKGNRAIRVITGDFELVTIILEPPEDDEIYIEINEKSTDLSISSLVCSLVGMIAESEKCSLTISSLSEHTFYNMINLFDCELEKKGNVEQIPHLSKEDSQAKYEESFDLIKARPIREKSITSFRSMFCNDTVQSPDPFDIAILDQINVELHKRCERLSFHYERYETNERRISIQHNGHDVSDIKIEEPKNGLLLIESNSESRYKNKKFNSCLRLFAGIIASKEKCGLLSAAINPVSLFSMLRLFDCEIKTLQGYVKQGHLSYPECVDLNKTYGVVEIRTTVPDYDRCMTQMSEKLAEIICADLGGTRSRRRRRTNGYSVRASRKYLKRTR